MFSRTERAFLQLLTEGTAATTNARLEAEFPNPAYRRKLMWGIRQKASGSLADWQLYAKAVRRDGRILPRDGTGASDSRPLFADPLVTILADLQRIWTRRKLSLERSNATASSQSR